MKKDQAAAFRGLVASDRFVVPCPEVWHLWGEMGPIEIAARKKVVFLALKDKATIAELDKCDIAPNGAIIMLRAIAFGFGDHVQ